MFGIFLFQQLSYQIYRMLQRHNFGDVFISYRYFKFFFDGHGYFNGFNRIDF